MTTSKPVRVRCPLGGYAPCIDDLCHGGDQTLCGLERDEDFCHHGYVPETCPECSQDDDAWGDGEWDEDEDLLQVKETAHD